MDGPFIQGTSEVKSMLYTSRSRNGMYTQKSIYASFDLLAENYKPP